MSSDKDLREACRVVRESVDRLTDQPYSPPVGKLIAAAEVLAAEVQKRLAPSVTLELHGVEKLIEGLNRAMVELRPHRQRLIQMGLSPEEADEFLGEVSEIIARELFRGLTVTGWAPPEPPTAPTSER